MTTNKILINFHGQLLLHLTDLYVGFGLSHFYLGQLNTTSGHLTLGISQSFGSHEEGKLVPTLTLLFAFG